MLSLVRCFMMLENQHFHTCCFSVFIETKELFQRLGTFATYTAMTSKSSQQQRADHSQRRSPQRTFEEKHSPNRSWIGWKIICGQVTGLSHLDSIVFTEFHTRSPCKVKENKLKLTFNILIDVFRHADTSKKGANGFLYFPVPANQSERHYFWQRKRPQRLTQQLLRQ